MKFKVLLSLLAFTCFFPSCSQSEQDNNVQNQNAKSQSSANHIRQNCCNLEIVEKISDLYVYSLPMFASEGLESFVRQNAAQLKSTSCMIQCMKKAGNRMYKEGVNAYNPNDYNRAYGRVLEMGGQQEWARDIAGAVQQPSISAIFMGQDLSWLASVIPQAADGNWQPFLSTAPYFRTMMQQEWANWKLLTDMYDASISDFLQQYLKANRKQIANQVAYSIIMFAN